MNLTCGLESDFRAGQESLFILFPATLFVTMTRGKCLLTLSVDAAKFMIRNNRWIWAGGIGCVLLFSAVLFIWLPLAQPSASFQILFLSITNEPTRGALAYFSITNQSSSTISCTVCPPQIKSHGVWSSLPSPFGTGIVLSPHQVTTFTTPASMSGEVWRVPVFWGCVPTGVEFLRAQAKTNIRRNWFLLRHGRSLKFYSNPEFVIYASYSPEVVR